MDKNRTEGTKHEIKGAVKELVGKVTGNRSKEIAGKTSGSLVTIRKMGLSYFVIDRWHLSRSSDTDRGLSDD